MSKALGLNRVNFFIDPNVQKALQWLAKTRGTTLSEVIRQACKKYAVEAIRVEVAEVETLSKVVGE